MSSPETEKPNRSNVAPINPPAAPRGRGRQAGIEPKERPDIPANQMRVAVLTGKRKADQRRKREARKPQQTQVDELIYSIYEENVANGFMNGTIANWPDLYVYDWPVSKEHFETVEFLINKACRFYNRRPIWGEKVEVAANKTHMIPNPEDEETDIPCHLNGTAHIHVPFTVVRKPTRAPRS